MLRGLRITVETVVRLVAAGWSFEQIRAEYPDLERADVQQALKDAAAEQAVTRLASQPGLGSPRHAVELDWPGPRSQPLERFPFLIFPVEQTVRIDVLRVLNADRDLPTSLQEPAPGS